MDAMNGQEHSYLKELPVIEHDAAKRAKMHELTALKGAVAFKVAEDEHDAHGGSTVWPCGAYLLDSIVEAPNVAAAFTGADSTVGAAGFKLGSTLAGKQVLDLGGGTGFVAMGLCAAGADVTSTELADCLPLLALNAETFNNTYAHHHHGSGHMDANLLDWKHASESKVDFSRYDVMVACECVYAIDNLGESACAGVMLEFLRSGPGKRVVIAYEERDLDIEADVFGQLKAKGASVVLLRQSAPVKKSEGNPLPDPVHFRIALVTMPHA